MIRDPTETVKDKAPSRGKALVGVPALSFETPIHALKGVGPRRLAFFKRLGIQTVRDLLYHFPRRHEDRRAFLPIGQLTPGQKVTVRGQMMETSLFRARTGTVILQVTVKDSSGTLTALWFNQPYMRRWFPIGQEIILYGTAERIGRRFQMAAPEFELVPKTLRVEGEAAGVVRSLHMGRVVPIYPATSGLHQRELRAAVAEALARLLPALKDPVSPSLREKYHLVDLASALRQVHFPPLPESVEAAHSRLAFDELFAFQLALALRRKKLQSRPGIAHQVSGDLLNRWKEQLPFTLTVGQEKAMQEIALSMASPRPMNRLVQGEVGSGKTVVAAFAIVVALQNGFQSVLMAPTEVLARQHALTLTQLLAPIDVEVRLLTGSLEKPQRIQLASDLAEGAVPVLVGTHSVLEPWVTFPRLGLVVIDEQQKFGVDQRNALVAKGLPAPARPAGGGRQAVPIGRQGKNPDVLILTATPIPRTLALTLYGEMEISTITERPAGRLDIRTLWMDSTRRGEVYAFVKSELEAGRQAYVVCPRIGKEEKQGGEGNEGKAIPSDLFVGSLSLATATEVLKEYQQIFSGFRIALLHGRMSPPEQKMIFAAFKGGEIQLLVATQIIEVGVDVPNATVIVIEGAERFGLAQLHQLRGRVGRGTHEATCILMADPAHPEGAERLRTVVEAEDAFTIAEEDLRLRGPGELLGKRQAGLPDLKCLQWAAQTPWLEVTKHEAQELLEQDPALSSPDRALLKQELSFRFPELVHSCA